jgi:hypothetical protein
MFTHTGPKSRRYRFHVRCGEQHSRGQWCAKQTRTGCSRPTINIAYGMCFASHAAQVRGQLCGIVYIKLDRQGGSARGGVVRCEFRHLTQVNRPQNTCGVSCVRTLAVRVSHFLVPASIHGGDSVSKTSTMLRACEHACVFADLLFVWHCHLSRHGPARSGDSCRVPRPVRVHRYPRSARAARVRSSGRPAKSAGALKSEKSIRGVQEGNQEGDRS